jgi:hypothetical protein
MQARRRVKRAVEVNRGSTAFERLEGKRGADERKRLLGFI